MSFYLTSRSIRFLTFLTFLATPGWLGAQAPAVQPVPATSGFAFSVDHTVNDEIWFTGISVFPNPAKQPNRYKTFLNGEDLSSAAGFPLVPVGPFAPPGGWPSAPGYQYPFRASFNSLYNLMAPVVSDVLDTSRGYVIQRKRTLLYDRRYFDSLITRSTLAIPRGVGVQLTADGLEKLEDLHTVTLPQRSLDEFNDALKDTIGAESNEASPDVRLFANGDINASRVCLPYSTVRLQFPESLNSVSGVLADAISQYALYEGLQRVQDNTQSLSSLASSLGLAGAVVTAITTLTIEATIDDACVKQIPSLAGPLIGGPLGGGGGDFEICFAKLEGEVLDADLFWVDSVELELSAVSGQIDADPIELGVVEGTARINLRDAFIRYTKGDEGCGNISVFSRPEADFDNTIFNESARANWAQCPNVTFRAESALNRVPKTGGGFTSTPVSLAMGIDASNPEKVDFSQVELGTMFDLINTGDITADQGACALSAPLEDEAEEVAEAFYPIVEAALGTTWDQLTPTRHARAMDLLFEPFELGAFEPGNHQITWKVIETGTDEDFAYPPNQNPDGEPDVFGIFALMDAEKAEPRSPSLVVPPVNTFVHQHWGNFTGAHPPTALWPKPRDGRNDAYDVAMTMSVSALNQILGAQFSTDKLRFSPDSSGVDLPSTPQFDKAVTRLKVEPSLAPFLYISPEPHVLPSGGLPTDGVPMSLNLADLQVTLGIDPDGGDPNFIEAVRFAVDVHDFDVELRFSATHGKRTLDFLGGPDPQFDIIPLYSKIPGCPITKPVGHQLPPNDCLAAITADVKTAIEDEVLDRLHSMLAEIPAPQFWSPTDDVQAYVQIEPLSNQTIPGGSLYVVFGGLGPVREGPLP